MAAFTQIGPLRIGLPIVDKVGGPTPQFMRAFNGLFGNDNFTKNAAATAQGAADDALAAVNDTTAEAERIRDVIGAALVAGANVIITVSDAGDTITIAASGSGSAFAFDGGSAAIGGRGFVLDGGTSAARSDLDFWADGGSA